MLPDYRGGSIVNLMSSFAKHYGVKHTYKQLPKFSLSQKKTVVFVVLDGLGYEWLQTYGKNSFLYKYTQRKLTSVFPSTTSAAMTCLHYGVPAQQHGLTGWYMYARELGSVIIPLPFLSLAGQPYEYAGFSRSDFFLKESFCEKLPVSTFTIYPHDIAELLVAGMRGKKKHRVIGYDSVEDFFTSIRFAYKYHTKKKFIFAYWPGFDSACHESGVSSSAVKQHFQELDAFCESLCGEFSNATVVITADHGLIDSPKKRRIDLQKHPKLRSMLSIQLTGEPRAAYCYVRLGMEKAFRAYVKKHLSHACVLKKSSSLLSQGYFGLGKLHPKLHERIGDYTLLMKDDYVIGEGLLDNPKRFFEANHGGTSSEEMLVPLIVVEK